MAAPVAVDRCDTLVSTGGTRPLLWEWRAFVRRLFGLLRLGAGLAILTAVIGQFAYTAARATINPFNFFGYFTIQSNLITMVAFLASAFFILTRRKQPDWVILLRAVATTIIAIVGLVYNTLLAGAALGDSFNLTWSSNILHIVIPIYALVDWVLFADRRVLSYREIWMVLIYPIVWLVVILIRGATDGWVPYPFLDPATGYGSVAAYSLGIAAVTVLFGFAVFALSRLRILTP